MATRNDFRELAKLRLREAEYLYKSGMYDGCAYLCGYVIEFALKARVCKILKLKEYPDKGELGRAFRTHDFEVLKLLAGLQGEISITRNVRLFENWSIVTEWRPEQRYAKPGTYSQARARDILDRIKESPDGVLNWLTKRW